MKTPSKLLPNIPNLTHKYCFYLVRKGDEWSIDSMSAEYSKSFNFNSLDR